MSLRSANLEAVRISGWPAGQYHIGFRLEEFDMRLPDSLKSFVCFLCGKKKTGNYDAVGTVFFIGVRFRSRPDVVYVYLVTAKHVLDDAKPKGYRTFHLRVNTVDGGLE